jgi:FG-GAP-like repeat
MKKKWDLLLRKPFDCFSKPVLAITLAPFLAIGFFGQVANRTERQESKLRFQHHYVDPDLPRGGPDGKRFNYGQTALTDLDIDGDLDFITGQQQWAGGNIYWYEFQAPDQWARHLLGQDSPSDVGAAVLDVDGDGRTDLITGGVWYRNPGNPRQAQFERIVFDKTLASVHDVVVAQIDRDGKNDIVTMSDKNNLRWYRIPEDPRQPWQRVDIGSSVHAGIAPSGVGDLDGDGDSDIIRTNVWFENADGSGTKWIEHPDVPFGMTGGPWPLASRSVILDLDKDGDNDVVVSDNEYKGGKVAWLENMEGPGKSWRRHDLPASDSGQRGAYHSLAVADFDGDGDRDVFSVEMESETNFIRGERPPRFFIWENLDGKGRKFVERVILDTRLGGHEAVVGDVEGDGDVDIVSKIWGPQSDNALKGKGHADFLENLLRSPARGSRSSR